VLILVDVIGELSFSKRFGFMDVGSDDGSFQQIEGALKSAAWIGQIPAVSVLKSQPLTNTTYCLLFTDTGSTTG
jgi:hypothetical protein